MTTSEPLDPLDSANDVRAEGDSAETTKRSNDVVGDHDSVEPEAPVQRTYAAPTALAARRHPLAQPARAPMLHDDFDDEDDDDLDDDEAVMTPTASAPASSVGPGAPRLALVTPTTSRDQQELSAQIDRLSLEQALLDVEVANARVLDLTARLVEANQRIATLSNDVDLLRQESAQVKVVAEVEVAAVRDEMLAQQAHLDAQRSSTAFRWAAKVWNLRNAIKS